MIVPKNFCIISDYAGKILHNHWLYRKISAQQKHVHVAKLNQPQISYSNLSFVLSSNDIIRKEDTKSYKNAFNDETKKVRQKGLLFFGQAFWKMNSSQKQFFAKWVQWWQHMALVFPLLLSCYFWLFLGILQGAIKSTEVVKSCEVAHCKGFEQLSWNFDKLWDDTFWLELAFWCPTLLLLLFLDKPRWMARGFTKNLISCQ